MNRKITKEKKAISPETLTLGLKADLELDIKVRNNINATSIDQLKSMELWIATIFLYSPLIICMKESWNQSLGLVEWWWVFISIFGPLYVKRICTPTGSLCI